MTNKIHIMVVDDHFVVRMGLAGSINIEPDMIVETEVSTGAQALEQFRLCRPDIVLMDLRLPGMDGVEATSAICKEFPDAAVIMLSTHEGEEDVYRSFQAGRAHLHAEKLAAREDLIRTIRAVHAGQRCISPAIGARLAERMGRAELTAREIEISETHRDGQKQQRDWWRPWG